MTKEYDTEVIAFIASVFCGCTEGREKMTQEEALYTISAWKAEGIELPKHLDAYALSHYWNEFCEG